MDNLMLLVPLIGLLISFIVLAITATNYLDKATKLIQKQLQKAEELPKDSKPISEITTLRLQAYERMALYLERTSINNLVLRLAGNASTVGELRQLLVEETRNELNHNLSQQIYMSHDLWQRIQRTQQELSATINQTALALDSQAPAKELAVKLLEQAPMYEQQGTTLLLKDLKAEIQSIF